MLISSARPSRRRRKTQDMGGGGGEGAQTDRQIHTGGEGKEFFTFPAKAAPLFETPAFASRPCLNCKRHKLRCECGWVGMGGLGVIVGGSGCGGVGGKGFVGRGGAGCEYFSVSFLLELILKTYHYSTHT